MRGICCSLLLAPIFDGPNVHFRHSLQMAYSHQLVHPFQPNILIKLTDCADAKEAGIMETKMEHFGIGRGVIIILKEGGISWFCF